VQDIQEVLKLEGDEISEEWGKLSNEELCHFYSTTSASVLSEGGYDWLDM
jgi:hypothetical protein